MCSLDAYEPGHNVRSVRRTRLQRTVSLATASCGPSLSAARSPHAEVCAPVLMLLSWRPFAQFCGARCAPPCPLLTAPPERCASLAGLITVRPCCHHTAGFWGHYALWSSGSVIAPTGSCLFTNSRSMHATRTVLL